MTKDIEARIWEYGFMPSAVLKPRTLRNLQLAWVGLAVVLVVGVLSASLSGDLSSDQPGSSSEAEVAGAPNLDLDGQTAVDAHYAGVDLNLTEARPVPVNSSGRPIIVVSFEAHNTTEFQMRLPMKQFTLVKVSEAQITNINSSNNSDLNSSANIDGTMPTVIAMDRFEYSEHSDRLVLNPGETTEATAVFKLLPGTSTDLEGWSFQINEPGRWAASIPLTGSVAGGPTIQPLAFADPAQSDTVTEYVDSQISVLDTESSLDFNSYRAPLGKHLALFVVEIASTDGKPAVQLDNLIASANDREFWNLTIGDDTHDALQVEVRGESDSSTTFVVVFTYPADSTDLILHAEYGKLALAELVIETL